MAEFIVSTNATLQAARSFLSASNYFDLAAPTAQLLFNPKWTHGEPFAIAMIAAWGAVRGAQPTHSSQQLKGVIELVVDYSFTSFIGEEVVESAHLERKP